MSSAKETVNIILKSFPEDATFEDILYEIYVQQNIEIGLTQEKHVEVISEENANKWLEKWLN